MSGHHLLASLRWNDGGCHIISSSVNFLASVTVPPLCACNRGKSSRLTQNTGASSDGDSTASLDFHAKNANRGQPSSETARGTPVSRTSSSASANDTARGSFVFL